MSKRLLCVSYRFPPETHALAIRVGYMVNHLRENGWTVDAITAADEAAEDRGLNVHHVESRTPERLLQTLKRLRLKKVVDFLVWPDAYVFWVPAAYRRARDLLSRRSYDAIAVFMMPYSTGIVGLLLERHTDVPVLFNLNDSPTCSDMNPVYPSRLHHRAARALEDRFARSGDALVYVSQRNLQRVRQRQPAKHRDKFHLIRRGAPSMPDANASRDDVFRINYTGGTSGWYRFLDEEEPPTALQRAYRSWRELGTYEHIRLDHRTHSPVYVGEAVKRVIDRHPGWRGRIRVDVYGERYDPDVTDAVLNGRGLDDIVRLHGPVPHREALHRMTESDLLFMALPDRLDGSPGSRISATTYEFLSTDRPILAALPPGENRTYLQDKRGVHLTAPDDISAMARHIEDLAGRAFRGGDIAVDRSDLRPSLSKSARAASFAAVLDGLAHTVPAGSAPSAAPKPAP